jgi:integrase/recombinase XerD
VSGLFRFAHIDGLIDSNPAEYVRRPRVPEESNRNGLDRMEMGAFIHRAQAAGPMDHALACLLGLLGLRVGEATGLNIEDLHEIDGHHTIHLIGKGNKPAVVPLPPRVARACDAAIGDRQTGPLLLARSGRRMDRHAATRIVQRVAKAAGITKHLSPHSLRHAFITNALDAGVPLRDVQIAARHADPRTTTRYDRNRNQLDRHASYIVTAYIAGAT